jgi:hypothetical protein
MPQLRLRADGLRRQGKIHLPQVQVHGATMTLPAGTEAFVIIGQESGSRFSSAPCRLV